MLPPVFHTTEVGSHRAAARYRPDQRRLGRSDELVLLPLKGHSAWDEATAKSVQGFGCRPVETYAAVQEAGFRKPPRKEPAGADWAVCRLWGFAGAACCVVDALAVGISD